ncbi:MAG: pilus assembly protein [Kiloniellales bacterium]|nr:pilus assembly protein [Kiloniellales bacterium]
MRLFGRLRPRGRWRRLLRSERGSSAVEFAFVIPVLIAILGGIIQFGAIFFLQNNMASVARDAARRFAVGEMTEAEAETYAQNQLVNWGVTFSVDASPPDPSDPTDTDVSVVITVPLADAAIVDLGGFFGTGNLAAQAVMRQE